MKKSYAIFIYSYSYINKTKIVGLTSIYEYTPIL